MFSYTMLKAVLVIIVRVPRSSFIQPLLWRSQSGRRW